MDAGFEKFHIFYAKKRPFFFDFWIFLMFGLEARKKIGISISIFAPEKVSGRVPPKTVHLKIPSFLKSDATLRVASHFKNEGIYRFGPPLFRWTCEFFNFFHFFLRKFIFLLEKKKEAPQAPEKKMMPRPRRRRGKKCNFF